MADHLHPPAAAGSPPPPSSGAANAGQNQKPPTRKLPPPPASYVVRIPRDQILRHPPLENAKKYERLRGRKNRRSCCCRFCCFAISLLLLLLLAAAVSAGVMYLIFGFKSPTYTVTKVSIKGMNLTSVAPISPVFDVSIRAENPNGKVGIYYLKDSAVSVSCDGVGLAYGSLPDLYQPENNVTVMPATLAGSGIALDGAVKTTLKNAQSRGKVPLVINVEAPVKFKVGSAKTWEITAKVKCDVVLNTLNAKATIVSKNCDYSVKLW